MYVGTNSRNRAFSDDVRSITRVPCSTARRRAQDLRAGQRPLVELMRKHQCGRIENIAVRAGQPIIDSYLKVVRVAHFGGRAEHLTVARADQFELKR